MPVRLLTQSLLRWPEASEVLQGVSAWAVEQGVLHPGLERVGVHGSYGRGDAGFSSDLDLVLIDAAAEGPSRGATGSGPSKPCRSAVMPWC